MSEYEVPVDAKMIVIPALICGIPAGILSVLPLAEDVCCLWVILAGGLAVFLLKYFYKIKGKISLGKAALTGGLAGLVASLIIVGNLALVVSQEDFGDIMEEAMTSPEWEEALEDSEMTEEEIEEIQEVMRGFSSSFFQVGIVVLSIASLILLPLIGALGGVITNEIIK